MFSLPTFNLVCQIYDNVTLFPRLTSPCNLAWGKRVHFGAAWDGTWLGLASPDQMMLLLPALTDIRDYSCGGLPDIVEVPQATGRYYLVSYVDDIGKGFTNEHRCAMIVKSWDPGQVGGTGSPWPIPIP